VNDCKNLNARYKLTLRLNMRAFVKVW